MWLLVSVLCAQTGPADAVCLRDVQGPYALPITCRERVEGQAQAVQAVADDLGAKLLFLSVTCQKGMDG